VLVDASLPWVDRDLVTTLRRAGVMVIAIGSSARPLDRIGARCFATDVTADAIAGALYSLDDETERGPTTTDDESAPVGLGRLVAVWSGAGAPGRTALSIHLAVEAARGGVSTLLIDADVWSASIAQMLGLSESPSLAQAARFAGDGWPSSLAACVQPGPDGLDVLVGLARTELWPEVREEAWRSVLAAAVLAYGVVVVDVAAPIEADEELAYDRVPFRRNLVTTITLARADEVVLVAAADPIGLRRAVVAHRTLGETQLAHDREVRVVLNRAPRPGRRLQDCSRAVSEWIGPAPIALLPHEPAFDRMSWEGRTLHQIAPRSKWLRELRPLVDEVIA
jgi:MinD-like ATPase involved in chromosome partitioning or flagellar assembly